MRGWSRGVSFSGPTAHAVLSSSVYIEFGVQPGGSVNREWVLFQLREGQEELNRTIAEIAADPDYDVGEFIVAMQHFYHHLNTAWNLA